MLRPATPLTILFLIAFVLLLLSTLSVPVIKGIPLASNNGMDFGVWGSCNHATGICSKPTIGYNRKNIDNASQDSFDLVPNVRVTLSYILIVHPIATAMIFVCTILAAAAHFRSPSHSPRYLLGLLIFSFPTLLVTLLAFLVDILLFIPHLSWGGWIVLPATIIVTACGVLTCAMRRTLVSRKARKKRVDENEDMNGQAYYANKAETPFAVRPSEPDYVRAESPPPLDNIPMDKLGSQSAYEYGRSGGSSDDRTPLNPRYTARGANGSGEMTGSTMVGGPRDGANDDLLEPVSPLDGPPRLSSDSRSRSRDQRRLGPYGNGRGGPPPMPYGRRGGYPPRGPRGGYGPPRGNYPPRGGYSSRGGPRGPPPPGWGMDPRSGPMMRGRAPPPGYGYGRSPPRTMDDNAYPPPQGPPQGGLETYPPLDPYAADEDAYNEASPHDEVPYSYDQPPVPATQVQSQSVTRDPASFGFMGPRPASSRSQVGSMRNQTPPPPLPVLPPEVSDAVELDARNSIPTNELGEQALKGDHAAGTYLPIDTWRNEPVELGDKSPPVSPTQASQQAPAIKHGRTSSSSYYEDVDPRFSSDEPPLPSPPQILHSSSSTAAVPSALMPGVGGYSSRYQAPNTHLAPTYRDDSHSPAHSDNSNFTSISQRGVNPDWQPSPSGYNAPSGYNPRPAPRPRQDDSYLANNPDFVLPRDGTSGGHARGMSGGGGGRYPDAGM